MFTTSKLLDQAMQFVVGLVVALAVFVVCVYLTAALKLLYAVIFKKALVDEQTHLLNNVKINESY